MGSFFGYYLVIVIVCVVAEVLATQSDHEPMVAFICNKPAMHKGVNGWLSDPNTKECWDDKRKILDYCKQMYPNHNITNVVENSYLITIPGWPSLDGNSLHTHRVRPFRCIVDNFQSDALLVPQHCKFDHKHDEQVCKGFSHWEVQARDACAKDGMHCESFGMLLNCGLGTFSGVEYVCCPNETPTHVHPTSAPVNTVAANTNQNVEEDDDDDADEDDDVWESSEDEDDVDEDEDKSEDNESKSNLYEQYLKGASMSSELRNEHQKFVAARQFMHKLQEAKNTQLMKEWTAARDHVNEVRKTDVKTAEKLSKEITDRFQRLYNAYEQEDMAEKQQIVALHQQRVQSDLNQRKRVAMDKYMRSLEKGDVTRIGKNLRNYIKAEEKDTMHTVNHYSHVKATDQAEAARIHPHVIQHLKLCQQRMEQALEMLQRYPDIEKKVRPETEEFMKRFDDMAARIRNVVLPEPSTANIQTDTETESVVEAKPAETVNTGSQPQRVESVTSTEHELGQGGFGDSLEDSRENEHDYFSHKEIPHAQHQQNSMHIQQGLRAGSASNSAQLGTTFGIAIGSVAIFVVLVVAVVMLRRRSNTRTNVTHGYVEVDPAASPEERHVANMQMNGYENPTYRYFEVQATK